MKTKQMAFKYGMLLVCAHGLLLNAAIPNNKPKLTNQIIKWLDNKPLALDCAAMGDILHVRRELRKMQHGVPDAETKSFTGFYLFGGELRTLQWLAEYEKALEAEFLEQKNALEKKYTDYKAYQTEWKTVKKTLEDDHEKKCNEQQEHLKRTVKDSEEHDYELLKLNKKLFKSYEELAYEKEEEVKGRYIKNKTEYDKELKVLMDHYKQNRMALMPCLKAAVDDFIKANEPFSAKMEGTKQMLLKLVEEFCLKYRRPYSFLLEWADVDDGQEFIIFEKNITNCRALHVFITDLVDFLEALYYSCEKARSEFEAKQKEKMKK
jgi:hypothetical protein